MGELGMGDFEAFEKIDMHVHLNNYPSPIVEQALQDGFKAIVTVNTDADTGAPWTMTVPEQQDLAVAHEKDHPGKVFHLASFQVAGFWEDDWQEKTIGLLRDRMAMPCALGCKLWKNIGMSLKDQAGGYVMVDHPRLQPIIKWLEVEHTLSLPHHHHYRAPQDGGHTVLGHIGEPRNCWLPVEEMTVGNDRDYFSANPMYHMLLHPEVPSYERQIEARDMLLERHPRSLEWSLEELSKRLQWFPQMAVDFAHRMGHVQYISQRDRAKVRDFFLKYQDQLMYGTDLQSYPDSSPAEVKALCARVWRSHWRYLATDEMMTAPEVEGEFQGLALPVSVLRKLYSENAKKWFPRLQPA